MFRSAASVRPHLARLRFNFGTFLLDRGRYAEAIDQLKKAVHRDATNPDAWTNLGVAQVKAGDRAHARDSFERALRIDPAHAVARQNLTAIGDR
jgi:Tfp pilus assembly protein PilF